MEALRLTKISPLGTDVLAITMPILTAVSCASFRSGVFRTTQNSSPPVRATVPVFPTRSIKALETAASNRSLVSNPCPSFTLPRLSRSMHNTWTSSDRPSFSMSENNLLREYADVRSSRSSASTRSVFCELSASTWVRVSASSARSCMAYTRPTNANAPRAANSTRVQNSIINNMSNDFLIRYA